MKWYPWLQPHFKRLIIHYQSKREHHALLVQALSGMGDDALIYAIIRFLMCQNPVGHNSCKKCHGCKLMQSGTHPDYYTLEPEKDKSALGIEAVRDVSEKLYKHARLGGAKVVWLTDAALLTKAATNALLKTLEEPPEKTRFFLSCREPGRLLVTLRSRCQLYHLKAPQEEWALNWLQRKVTRSQDSMLAALRLCYGAPAAALELLQENYWMQRSQLCSSIVDAIESCNWLNLLAILNHEQTCIHLQWIISLLIDALKLQQGASTITNVDALLLVKSLASLLASDTLHTIVRDLCQCHEQLLTVAGINRELMLTDLLMSIEYYLQPCTILPIYRL